MKGKETSKERKRKGRGENKGGAEGNGESEGMEGRDGKAYGAEGSQGEMERRWRWEGRGRACVHHFTIHPT